MSIELLHCYTVTLLIIQGVDVKIKLFCYNGSTMNQHQHFDIVILGAGIGGYETFRSLTRLLKKSKSHKTIAIVDQNDYFGFTPLFHEAASGSIEPVHCAIPLTEVVQKTNHSFIKAGVKNVDPEKKTVTTDQGEITYNYCVVALGSNVNYYNIPGAQQHSYSVRTLADAIKLKEHFISKAEKNDSLSVSVVGGGFTGVEVAGQFAYTVKYRLKKLFRRKKFELNLIQNAPSIVPSLSEKVRKKISARLRDLGVKIYLKAEVKEVQDSKVLLNGNGLASDITIWCAGNKNIADRFFDKKYCENGRLPVTEFLNFPLDENIYAVGDIVLGHNPNDQVLFPQLGEAAHKEGQYAAKHIFAQIKNRPIRPFRFHSKGILMPVGDKFGIAIFDGFIFNGILAWLLRRTVYILFMPGIILRLRIIIDWTLRLLGLQYLLDPLLKRK